MRKIFYMGLVATGVLFSGCATATTSISPSANIEQNKKYKYAGFVIEEHELVNIGTPKTKEIFENKLQELLLASGLKKGKGLKIKYRFVVYNEGDRALRYLVGFSGSGAGKGEMTVQTAFYDLETDKLLGEISTNGKLYIGALGGSFEEVIQKIAEDIHSHVASNYL